MIKIPEINIGFDNMDVSDVTVDNVVVSARYINSAPWSSLVAGGSFGITG